MNDSRRYENARYAVSIAGFCISAGLLLYLYSSGWTFTIRDLAGSIIPGSSGLLTVFLYVTIVGGILAVVQAPLDFFSGFVLERRFGLSRQSLPDWIKDHVKGLLVSAALGLAAIETVYVLMAFSPDFWWMYAALLFIGFAVVLANLAPVLLLPLFFEFRPVENEDLRSCVDRLARQAGTEVRGVFEWSLGDKTRKANAAVVGLGSTRRVIVSDTLLENFSKEEIEVIMAHELCHHVKGHMWWSIGVQCVLSVVAFFAMDRVLSLPVWGFNALSDVANFPILVLTASAVSLMMLPLANYVSRQLETIADVYALDLTGDALAFVSSMEKLADLNLANKSPNRIVECLFYSHPSIEKRIQLAADRVGQIV